MSQNTETGIINYAKFTKSSQSTRKKSLDYSIS